VFEASFVSTHRLQKKNQAKEIIIGKQGFDREICRFPS
jgi:hypothetical protein